MRPSPRLKAMELPQWLLPAFAVTSALAWLTSGDLGILATTAAMILTMPVLLLGLAVVHALAGRLAMPGLALGLFYFALFFIWPLMVLVLGLGIVETFAQLRRRLA